MLLFSIKCTFGFIGDGGAGYAQLPYIIRNLEESIKRYKQLKYMIKQSHQQQQYLTMLNAGLENSIGLLESLPIQDEKILGELKNQRNALNLVNKVYGSIPRSKHQAMHQLHDLTISESFKMSNDIKKYAEVQEINANKVASQSRTASPKGAARMNAQTNAQILHLLSQILRTNGQLLKLTSEQFAYENSKGKDGAGAHQEIIKEIKDSPKKRKHDFTLPRF